MMNKYRHIDLAYVNELADQDQAFVKEMINDYLLTIPEYVKDLNQASAENNTENIHFFAHKLASSFLVMGARKLNEVALKIEHGIKSDLSSDELHANLEMINKLCEEAAAELNQELQHLNASN